jgi:hypothetical protein
MMIVHHCCCLLVRTGAVAIATTLIIIRGRLIAEVLTTTALMMSWMVALLRWLFRRSEVCIDVNAYIYIARARADVHLAALRERKRSRVLLGQAAERRGRHNSMRVTHAVMMIVSLVHIVSLSRLSFLLLG